MSYEFLLYSVADRIATITVNRPDKLNALSSAVILELGAAINEAIADDAVGGVILTGAGRAFVAGADISELAGQTPMSAVARAQRGQEIFGRYEKSPKPVIAAVNGFALGGGCELAMACHLRIATEKARFGQPEVNLGLIPGYGGTQRLIQYIGKTKAMELLLTADMIGAEDALRLGLVNYVVPAGEEIAKAKEILEKIATKAPLAVSKIIETVNTYFEDGEDGFEFEVNAFGQCCGTEDFIEGATAFVEKRKANFTGK